MDAIYITAFIHSTKCIFQTMLDMHVTFGKPELCASIPSRIFEVSGRIDMSGDLCGTVMLNFPMDSAQGIVNRFIGRETDAEDEAFKNAIGELVNMVSDGAKRKFEGMDVTLGCPSIVVGQQHAIQQPDERYCIIIPCQSDCGSFAVEVCIKTSCLEIATPSTNPAATTPRAGTA